MVQLRLRRFLFGLCVEKSKEICYTGRKVLKVIYDPVYDLLHINPGAAGKYGIHAVRTAIRFDINESKIENLEIGEWNKKLF